MSVNKQYNHLPSIDKAKGRLMRFVDVMNFSPMMGEARFTHDGIYNNFTQLSILNNPKDADMIQRHLDSRGYRQISFLGRGLYGLAFDADEKFVLNIRTINYYQYEKFAQANGIETNTVWSEATIPIDSEGILRPKRYKILLRGDDSRYLVCESIKLKTLEQAINEDTITEVQAECLRQSLLLKLAKEGYFLWDGRFANIGIGADFTPYVLDIGAAERFERLTNAQFIKGISNQNLGGLELSNFIKTDLKARQFGDMINFSAIDEMVDSDGAVQIQSQKVFGAKRFCAYMQLHEQQMPAEKIITRWDGKWADDAGVAKQDSQIHFEQFPERSLFSERVLQEIKTKTNAGRNVVSDAIEGGLYRHQWQKAVSIAIQDRASETTFAEKITQAVAVVKSESLKK